MGNVVGLVQHEEGIMWVGFVHSFVNMAKRFGVLVGWGSGIDRIGIFLCVVEYGQIGV